MILDQRLDETSFAVLDVETTGFNPGFDRVVELAVYRLSPGYSPELLINSLINPNRPVTAAGTHQIRLEDVQNAPTFERLAPQIAQALNGCVVAAHNALFDVRFLAAEFSHVGVSFDIPYVCTMDLRPLLDLGIRVQLAEACEDYGITLERSHTAAGDAEVLTQLFQRYLDDLAKRGVETFRDLAALKDHACHASWTKSPLSDPSYRHLTAQSPRAPQASPPPPPTSMAATSSQSGAMQVLQAFPVYAFALLEAVSDFVLTSEERERLMKIREASGLTEEQVRSVHASVYVFNLSQFSIDGWIDEDERRQLAALHDCLLQLGWAPGA